MISSKSKKKPNRSTHFHQIFKNSPSHLRRSYWLATTLLDLVGFVLIFLALSTVYSYLSLYLGGFWLRQLSLLLFFFILGVLGFFFHTKVTLSLLTFFYKWYDGKRQGNK